MHDGVRVSAIAAVADNGVIGVNGDLPWHLPADLRWFKRVTRGHAMIMGRKTWQTLPGPLPKRLNIVVSRRAHEVDTGGADGVVVVGTLEAALAAAADWERAAVAAGRIQLAEIMIVGGSGIYAAMWPWVDRFYRTRIALRPAGDTRFPTVDLDDFAVITSTPGVVAPGSPAHVFEVLDRRLA